MERRGPFSAYKDWLAKRRSEEADVHAEPNAENTYWLVNKLRKPHKSVHFDDPRGYKVFVKSYEQSWTYTGGEYAGSNDAVRIDVTQPLKVGGMSAYTSFSFSFKGKDEKIFVETCVINADDRRVGDLRMDYLQRYPKDKNTLGLDNWAHDSNDDEFGFGIGDFFVDDRSAERIIGSAFRVAHAFITKGELLDDVESGLIPAQVK